MPTELNLRFPDAQHVIVTFDGVESGELPFSNPIAENDLRDIQWYVETYGAHSLGDPDDSEATRIKGLLPEWGKKLIEAVFNDRAAERLLNRFQDSENDSRLLTISTEHPAILVLPWELLHDPAPGGGFLFMENPRISIRRRMAGATGGRGSFDIQPKDALHLLFVVSRPDDAGFLDPRADSLPVLNAIDEHAPGRVTCEFLRPPTLDALTDRLEDKSKPAVDIVHFDGHGVFDRHGGLPQRAAEARATRIARLDELLREKKVDAPHDPDSPPNTGYLLFENADGHCDFISADKLGRNLHRHKVSLVILSACQSAAVEQQATEAENDETKKPAMGSVAARLTATGIPSVLAMTHSVLVATTQILFGEFYKELARYKGIGESLDNARRYLANHPEKFEVQRGPQRVKLKLHDWFLPALYQPGADGPLLKATVDSEHTPDAVPKRSNLEPAPEAGFFGRKRALWEIERWFAGPTRRITLTGFGGQGKTALAEEAGRWLLRAGLFHAVVFVDYSRIDASNALGSAVANIGKVLGESLIDADAATEKLKQTPTLIILDNLEALAPDSLQTLLSAAVPWSLAAGSRVLCTTRQPDCGHPDYKVEGTHLHRRIVLDGLGSKQSPDDALEWCAALMKLPPAPSVPAPKREALVALFDQVKFHPLSISVLAQQLKTRRPAELGERLEQLLELGNSQFSLPESQKEDTPTSLLASLELSLDRLDEAAREALPKLGVFQGGAFEDDLVAITGLGDPHENQRQHLEGQLAAAEKGLLRMEGEKEIPPEILVQFIAELREQLAQLLLPPTANIWPALRRQLETAALIEAEEIPGVGVPFVRFHPTLAPMLWAQLNSEERAQLSAAHRQRYYALSGFLYNEDNSNPHQARAIAWRELPNLLHAVHASLDAGETDAADFADRVNKFLDDFGLKQETTRLAAKAQAAASEVGSQAWYLAQSNHGEQLLAAGQVSEAEQVSQAILTQLGHSPSFERATTLGRLGRCLEAGGRSDPAKQYQREAIAVCDKLAQSDPVRRLRGIILTDLANVLRNQGKYTESRKAYQDGLKVFEELNDLRAQGGTLGQLGTLAMHQDNLKEAAESHRSALALFQRLREPAMQAVAWHQLGMCFQEARQWDEAERHYRESARIKEENGMISGLNGAAATWNQLAIVNENAGKPDAAETWYRKAIEFDRAMGNPKELAPDLSNLADLLRTQPNRLAEARQLAEEALAISQTLDPNTTQIWKTYNILAQIADREAEATTEVRTKAEHQAEARKFRRLSREAKRKFAGTRHELRKLLPLIIGTIAAICDPEKRIVVENSLPLLESNGWTQLVAAIRRVIAGERDETAICEELDLEDSMIIETILQGLADPSSLADLLPEDPPEES